MKKIIAMILVLSLAFTMMVSGFGASAEPDYDYLNPNNTPLQKLIPERGNLKGTFDPSAILNEILQDISENAPENFWEAILASEIEYYNMLIADLANMDAAELRNEVLSICQELSITLPEDVPDEDLPAIMVTLIMYYSYDLDISTLDFANIDPIALISQILLADLNFWFETEYTAEDFADAEFAQHFIFCIILAQVGCPVSLDMTDDELAAAFNESYPAKDVTKFVPYIYDYTLEVDNNDAQTLAFYFMLDQDFAQWGFQAVEKSLLTNSKLVKGVKSNKKLAGVFDSVIDDMYDEPGYAPAKMQINGKDVSLDEEKFTLDLSKADEEGNLNLEIRIFEPSYYWEDLSASRSVKGGTFIDPETEEVFTVYNVAIKVKEVKDTSKDSSKGSSETKPVPDTGTTQPVAILMVAVLAAGALVITKKHKGA